MTDARPSRPQTQAKSFRPESTQFFSVAMLELAREVPPWVKQAQSLLKDKKYAEAQATCDAGLKKEPRQLEGLLYLAEALWEQQQASGAIGALKEAIAAAPRDGRPYALLGRYLLLKGLREQAVKFLEQAVTLNPDDVQSRKQLDRTRNIIRRGAKKVDAAPGALAGQAVERATRMIQLPAAPTGEPTGEHSATAELPLAAAQNADIGVDAIPPELQKALAGLLTGNLFEVEGASERGGSGRARAFFRAVFGVLALVMAVVLGLGSGLYIRKRVAEARGGTPLERALALLRDDAASTTLAAADALEKLGSGSAEFEAAQPLLALAYAQLAVDFGGGAEVRESAERALNQLDDPAAPARRTPAALLARHLLTTLPPPADVRQKRPADETLAADFDTGRTTHARDAWMHVALARRAQDAGDTATALASWRRAHALDPVMPAALGGLARAHAGLGDREEALRLYGLLLQMRPTHPGALIGSLLLSAEDEAASAAMEKRLQAALDDRNTQPDDAARMALGLALFRVARKDDAGAAPLWARAETMSARLPSGAWELARIRLAAGEPDKAITLLARIAEENPVDLRFQRDLARAQAVAAMGPDALRELVTAFKGKTAWPVIRLPLGTVIVDTSMRTPWHAHLDHAAFPEATLAAATEGMGDLSPRAQVDRIRAASVVAQAQSMLLHGRAREARTLLKEALPVHKNEPDVFLLAARVELVLGDASAAERLARDALDMNPQDPRGRMALARALLGQKDSGAAVKELDTILDNGFESAAVHALKARALLDRGRDGEAARELKAALAVDPADPDAASVGAVIAFQDGRLDEALSALQPWARKDLEGMAAAAQADAVAGPLLALALHEVNREMGLRIGKELARERAKDPMAQLCLGLLHARRREKADALPPLQAFLAAAEADDARRNLAEDALKALGAGDGGAGGKPRKKGKQR